MLTICLPDLALVTAIEGTHRAPATGSGVWVRHAEHWGVLWASWGDLQVRRSQYFVGRLLGRVHNAVSRLCISSMPFESCLLLSQFLPTPQVMQFTIQYSGWGEREMSFFSIWGGQVLKHRLLISPMREITG